MAASRISSAHAAAAVVPDRPEENNHDKVYRDRHADGGRAGSEGQALDHRLSQRRLNRMSGEQRTLLPCGGVEFGRLLDFLDEEFGNFINLNF